LAKSYHIGSTPYLVGFFPVFFSDPRTSPSTRDTGAGEGGTAGCPGACDTQEPVAPTPRRDACVQSAPAAAPRTLCTQPLAQAILGLEEGGRWGPARAVSEAYDTPDPLVLTPGRDSCSWTSQAVAPRSLCTRPKPCLRCTAFGAGLPAGEAQVSRSTGPCDRRRQTLGHSRWNGAKRGAWRRRSGPQDGWQRLSLQGLRAMVTDATPPGNRS
jgi:hypothetical protein